MTVVAAIPAYNAEVYIKNIIKRTKLYVDHVVLVDDGSSDATACIAKNMGAQVIRHGDHLGKAAALATAFEEVKKLNPSVLVTIYANGFHNPDDIPAILNPVLSEDADVVNGVYVTSSGTGLDTTFEDVEATSKGQFFMASGFRAYSSKTLDVFKFTKGDDAIEVELINDAIKSGFKVREVPIKIIDPVKRELLASKRIGVVVPAYNEEKLIKATVEGIPQYVDRIYVINDASTDNTAKDIETLNDPRVFVITHETNKGVGAAIVNGYKQSLKEEMDVVAVMAGDNQMNPAQLPKLLMPIIEGRADYTKGNRLFSTEFREDMSRLRLLGNSMLTFITKIGSGYWNIMDPQNGYTAISKEALAEIGLDEIYTYYGYCNHMLVRLNAFGFRTLDVVMPARYGQEKSTIKYGPYMSKVSIMLFKKFLWRLKMKYMILSFHPLVLFYILSMAFLPAGVLFGMAILIATLMQWPVSANLAILDALILISGAQFLLFAMLFDMQESDKDIRGENRLYHED
ncbi:Glycosyltransferase, catalytic subunit of cellulose synthase and poly-beta-1,6-N-acetylglucosamine synthase [Methanococcoides vulcani]|uniref:Glycosyltransferase, catalytic subunit of cellulose synthase and poly-beta-1,6-N-acetylglucosamine synthase n=1 Tax=Methanococcoides vulcani TaxID=1353158 RepID=A0A1H9Z5W0_9EURY|nr:glycosyltransferase family 2 protein [Methanococcoides vulcani]SES76893.1 Glycosyltransferase, catalytic subunit of cellulose synthase and poly-beta-1,6-N-acetylglucosamine synthase [Methanococcoides vulcani]